MKVLASDGSQWLRDIQKDDDMTFEHKPYNPNKNGVSHGGFTGQSRKAERHPTDIDWSAWALRFAIAIALICAILGVTVWAPAGGTF